MRHQWWSFAYQCYKSSALSSLRSPLELLVSMAIKWVHLELASAPYSFLAKKN
jgi:hypothetical protein